MNNDTSLIAGMRQAVKNSSIEFCKAYNDFSQNSIGETLRSVLFGQLRIAEKLAAIENLYASQHKKEDLVSSTEISEFKTSQGK